MDLEQFLEINNEERLDEGLKFFKESKKLKKYANKIEAKLLSKQIKGKITSDEASFLKGLVNQINRASNDFEKLEAKYKVKELKKADAKVEHAKLAKKYGGILKDISNQKTKKLFIALGLGAAIVAGVTGIINPSALFSDKSMAASDWALKGPSGGIIRLSVDK